MKTLDEQSDALAHVYARSLFELCESQGGREKIEEIADELEQIVELARNDESFTEFLRSAILPVDERSESLRKIFAGQISDLTLNFLLTLNEKGRLDRVASITTAFDERIQERFGRVEVDVYTASPIDEGQMNALRDRIGAALGREPVLHAYTDESMLGGLRLRIGDQLIDGSLATRLRAMKRQLTTDGVERVRSRIDSLMSDTDAG
jgi:F-type H+-transporting ATPase subunit delta